MEQSSAGGVMATPKTKGLSMKGLTQVFFKPAAFFEQLKNDPKILAPYIAMVILVAAFLFLASDLMLKMQVESPEFQERMQGQEASPAVMSAIKITIIGGGLVVMALVPLLSAGLALFFGNFVMAGEARFKQVLSVTLYASLIWALGMILMVPLMLAKDSLLVSMSLAIFVADQGIESLAYVALSKIGLFYIWEIIVAGIGFAAIYNFPRNKGYWLAVLSVGMLSILHVAYTAIAKVLF